MLFETSAVNSLGNSSHADSSHVRSTMPLLELAPAESAAVFCRWVERTPFFDFGAKN